MPSHNGFNIRRLLNSPRRRRASVGVGAVDESDYSMRNRSSTGSSGNSTIGPATSGNNRSHSSLACAAPDEDEMRRIKAAVAAAASAAASNLRLRDDGDMYRPNTNSKGDASSRNVSTNEPSGPGASNSTTNTENTNDLFRHSPGKPISTIDPARIHARQATEKKPEKLRKKNRSSLKPIVVVERLASSDSHSIIPAEPPRLSLSLSLSFEEQKRQTTWTAQSVQTGLRTAHSARASQTSLAAQTAANGQTPPDTPPLSALPPSATSLWSCQSRAQPGGTPQSALAGNRKDGLCSSNDAAVQRLPAAVPPTPNPDQLSLPAITFSSGPPSPCSPCSPHPPAHMTPSLPGPHQSSPAASHHSYTCPRPEQSRASRKSTLASKKQQRRQSDGKKDSGVELSDDEQPRRNDSVGELLQPAKDLDPRAEPQTDNTAGPTTMQRPRSVSVGSISLPIHVHNISSTSIDKISTTTASPAEGGDYLDPGFSPTFTRPRRAPSPLGLVQMPVEPAAMTPPYTPPTSSTTFEVPGEPEPADATATTSPSPSKKQPRLSRFRPTSLARKPSNASTRMQRKRSKKSRRRDRTMSKASSILAGPQASQRSIAQKPQRHSISSGSRWTLPDNVTELFNGRLFSRMEVTEMLSPEQLQAIRENRSHSVQRSLSPPRKSTESETETVTETVTETAEQATADSVAEPNAEAESWPESEAEPSSQNWAPTPRQDLDGTPEPPQREPPPVPVSQAPPAPQRSPSSMATADMDGSETPIEPFHLQDLPSRIGAAGVRLSVLLPVEEEAACFAASTRKRSGPTTEAQETNEKPMLPPKNPLRYTKNKRNMPAIPELLVTDADSSESSNGNGPSNEIDAASVPIGQDPAMAIQSYAETLLPPVEVREKDPDNVYLPASPFSMAMPMYRHGPIRLPKPEFPEDRAPMLAADDTLDWTAFQMAILGGAGDFFSDSVDYGRSSADADELDDLVSWFRSSGVYAGRLIKGGDKSNNKKSSSTKAKAPRQSKPQPAEVEGSSWQQPASMPHAAVSEYANDAWGQSVPAYGLQYFPVAQDGGSRRWTVDGPQQRYSGDNSPYRNRSAQSSSSSVYSRGGIGSEVNSSTSTLPPLCVAEMPSTRTPPPLDASKFQPRKSCASFDSFESMPQSPMQDVIMSRGVGGMEYAVPMGYNLSHDLGDFLKWESENVYGGDF